MRISATALILLSALVWHSAARASSYDLGGYVKYLVSLSDAPYTDKELTDHLIHTRLNARWYPTEALTASVELRLKAFYGDSVGLPGFEEDVRSAYESPRLDAVFWKNDDSFGYGQLDRGFLDYTHQQLQVTLGRQRIAWGTALAWNVIDLFNPLSVLAFDEEERPGTDALCVQYYTGAVSKLELAAKPGQTRYATTLAGLWATQIRTYDVFALAGIENQRATFGGAWSGNIKGAGFRGETRLSAPPNKGKPVETSVLPELGTSLHANGNWVVSAVLSGDYTFSNSLYLHAEAMYNSNGKTDHAGAFIEQAREVGMLSPAQWSLFQETAYDLTPLLRLSLIGMLNPHDASLLLMPSCTWSATANLEVLLTGFYTEGGSLTEWGAQSDAVYLRLKYAF